MNRAVHTFWLIFLHIITTGKVAFGGGTRKNGPGEAPWGTLRPPLNVDLPVLVHYYHHDSIIIIAWKVFCICNFLSFSFCFLYFMLLEKSTVFSERCFGWYLFDEFLTFGLLPKLNRSNFVLSHLWNRTKKIEN
jgi:hypothetical protein